MFSIGTDIVYSCVVSPQVPKGFAYFCIDFGAEGGFAHVIEDEKSFPSYFGRVCIVLNHFKEFEFLYLCK